MLRTTLIAPIAAAALLFAACGDDDDTSTAAGDTDTEQTDVEDTSSEDTAGDDGGGDALESAATGECGFLTGFASAFDEFDPTTMYGGGEATDFGALFAPLAAAMAEVADAAPDEIRDSFQTMADSFVTVAEELEGVVVDFADPQNMDPEAMEKLENLETAFDEEFEAASDEVDAWMNENCADLADAFDLDAFGS